MKTTVCDRCGKPAGPTYGGVKYTTLRIVVGRWDTGNGEFDLCSTCLIAFKKFMKADE